LQALRQTTHGDYSVNDLLIAATAAALQRHPALNAHLVDGEIWTFDDINMGLAVDLEGGLIVPVLRGAGTLGLDGIRNERLRLVEGVRSGTTTPAELMDSTFTITNLGAWNIDAFTPIINPPQVAILGVGRMVDRPAAINGGLVVRPEMVLSVTFDHRALDGRGAAEFLDELCTLLASAERLGELVGAGSTPR
jgi:pyruvate dehydrogenase E2 component (dihydrolipoamide acetyltransferase)